MRYISGLIKLMLFVLLLSFAIANSGLVVLHYYFGYQWQAPLVLIILVVYVLGAATGVMACLGYLFRQRRELQSLRAALAACRSLPTHRAH
ncbi:MAG: LapA family protein [Betaproteobacteria bacterium]|nr:LapA family protein [Betaproteobacteria bacterium]